MFEKAKKLISLSTIKRIEWKSASREIFGLGALLVLFLFQGGLWSVLMFGGIQASTILKEKKGETRGLISVWALMNILLARGAGIWELGILLRIFLFLVSVGLYFIFAYNTSSRHGGASLLSSGENNPERVPRRDVEGRRGVTYRGEIKETAKTGLVFLIFMSGTYLRDTGRFWAFDLLVAFSMGMLMYEEAKKEGIPRKRGIIIALVIALISLQIAWIMNFLPLHPIGFSAGLTLIYLTFRRLLETSWKGGLRVEAVLKEFLVFGVIMLLILSSTSWGL